MEYLTAFLIGLAGSIHCAGMCGPLLLAVPGTALSPVRFAASRAAYNGGRILTYSILGVLFGWAGKTLALAGLQRWLALTAGSLLLLSLVARWRRTWAQPSLVLVGKLKAAFGFLLRRRSMMSVAALGALNGILPCGLVYVAAAGAAVCGSGVRGAVYMAAFGAGTLPMMMALAISGKLIPVHLRWKMQKAIPFALFIVGTLLIVRGLSLGIPHLSPNLSHGAPSCCAR